MLVLTQTSCKVEVESPTRTMTKIANRARTLSLSVGPSGSDN